jgi:hypothetical protein
VLDAGPFAAPIVSAQVRRGMALVNTSDPVDGDAAPSALVWINGGTAVYDVLVDKSGASAETYTLTYHCYTGADGTGDHTGTTLVTRQNQ